MIGFLFSGLFWVSVFALTEFASANPLGESSDFIISQVTGMLATGRGEALCTVGTGGYSLLHNSGRLCALPTWGAFTLLVCAKPNASKFFKSLCYMKARETLGGSNDLQKLLEVARMRLTEGAKEDGEIRNLLCGNKEALEKIMVPEGQQILHEMCGVPVQN